MAVCHTNPELVLNMDLIELHPALDEIVRLGIISSKLVDVSEDCVRHRRSDVGLQLLELVVLRQQRLRGFGI